VKRILQRAHPKAPQKYRVLFEPPDGGYYKSKVNVKKKKKERLVDQKFKHLCLPI
jgi:hypothetical protein